MQEGQGVKLGSRVFDTHGTREQEGHKVSPKDTAVAAPVLVIKRTSLCGPSA